MDSSIGKRHTRFGWLILIGMGLLLLGCSTSTSPEVDGMTYLVRSPGQIGVGQPFEITVTIANNGSARIMVDEIRLPAALLQGAVLNSISPACTGQVIYSDQTGYKFTLIMEPGQSATATFYMTGAKTGDFSGKVSVAQGTVLKESTLRVVVQTESVPVAQVNPTTQPPVNVPAATLAPQPTSQPLPTLPAPTASLPVFTPSGQVIFQDDFSVQSDEWYTEIYKEKGVVMDSIQYANGQLQIAINSADWNVSTGYDKNFSNVQISVDTTVIQPGADGSYGILCNYIDRDHHYTLEIYEDAYFDIGYYNGDHWTTLVEGTFPEGLMTGNSATLTATCAYGKLSLAYNNVILGEATDSTFTRGAVGLTAYSNHDSILTVAFDNVIIRQQ